MNFFKHQDDARKKTGQLVALLGLAILFLIVITTLVIGGLLYYLEGNSTSIQAHQTLNTSFITHLIQLVKSPAIMWIAGGVVAVVSVGSMYKASQLKKGGDYVAQALGGKILLREQATANQKVLLNVVEEMAIASGMPVPRVYLLHEDGINAFAAGSQTSNAVIGITQGCIDTLNRDELQGVIAHEFSHIHHGDMRLNMKLSSVLHGILVIGLIGEMLARSSSSRRGFVSRSRNKKGNGIAILGLALMAIGFGGVFFGNIIKAAVSRQREFLADASSVQYTRNPQGIAAALYKIKQNYLGSNLSSENAAEFSHFFFANGVSSFFSRVFATHPPVDERINRVYPNGVAAIEKLVTTAKRSDAPQTDAEFSNKGATGLGNNDTHTGTQPNTHTGATPDTSSGQSSSAPRAAESLKSEQAHNHQGIDTLFDQIGEINPIALELSKSLIASIPLILHHASNNPYQARAIVYALLLNEDKETKERQLSQLRERAHPVTHREFLKLYPHVANLDEQLKFPLLQLAQPALVNLSVPQANLFKENLYALAKADKQISLREWSVLTYILHSYEAPASTRSKKLNQLKHQICELLCFICLLNDARHQHSSLTKAVQSIWADESSYEPKKLKLKELNEHLYQLKQLNPLQKPQFLKAVAMCMQYDNNVSLREREILRTFAAVLDSPMPL